jgi:hypothetical protein
VSIVDTVRLLELRTQKAAGLIAMLRKEKLELQQKFDLVHAHNIELEEYVENYTTSSKLVEQSIASAMETLDSIEGLDEMELMGGDLSADLETADSFTGGGEAEHDYNIDFDALLEDSPPL